LIAAAAAVAGDAGEEDFVGEDVRPFDTGDAFKASGALSITSRDRRISAAAAVVPGVISEGSNRLDDERVLKPPPLPPPPEPEPEDEDDK